MKNMAGNYLRTFFEEKELPYQQWEITNDEGTWNLISNEVVIEHVLLTQGEERTQIENVIRKIDFLNGDVNDFLRHLAGALVQGA